MVGEAMVTITIKDTVVVVNNRGISVAAMVDGMQVATTNHRCVVLAVHHRLDTISSTTLLLLEAAAAAAIETPGKGKEEVVAAAK